MVTLAIVFGAIIAVSAIAVCVAFYRGWFQLAVVPVEDKMDFVLMSKKNAIGMSANRLPPKADPAERIAVIETTPDATRES
jgi:hypothetical protein